MLFYLEIRMYVTSLPNYNLTMHAKGCHDLSEIFVSMLWPLLYNCEVTCIGLDESFKITGIVYKACVEAVTYVPRPYRRIQISDEIICFATPPIRPAYGGTRIGDCAALYKLMVGSDHLSRTGLSKIQFLQGEEHLTKNALAVISKAPGINYLHQTLANILYLVKNPVTNDLISLVAYLKNQTGSNLLSIGPDLVSGDFYTND